MRLPASTAGFAALGMLAWGCSVYTSGLLPSSDELKGDGASSSGGTAGASSASGSGSGAKPSTAGMSSNPGGTFGSGGTDVIPSDGGDGGESPPATGGMAGASAGASGGGGVAGSGGKGGAGGTAGGGGTAGTGGTAPGVLCTAHPISMKSSWIPTASSSSPGNGTEADPLYNPPSHMLDGLTGERWSTGNPQGGAEWIQIDFGAIVNIKQITLQVFGKDVDDYPRSWAVRFTAAEDNKFASPILASGDGASGITTITLPTVATGQFLTIRQTGVGDKWWTIAELLVTCVD
jgi:F5/8 type C domain